MSREPEVVLLAVKQTPEVLMTGNGGIKFLTDVDLGGGGSGGLPSFQDILYTDDTNAQFIYKDTGTTTPDITAYLVPDGTEYTVGANPRPYTVNDLRVTSVDLGVKADASASTDSGTFSLIALFKRLLGKITSLISSQAIILSTSPQVLTVTGTSSASSAINIATTRVILTSTTDCWVAIGANPTASIATGSFFQPAKIPSYPISVNSGDKIAAIRDVSNGNLSIQEIV